ncbi:autotransporter outer membrane beta-barrel domain-containing protein [Snodgrassella communis]|uniref:autotransporter outer membrane beta-barrel domain-containing protein n=1 Tax=Snodgrassella communis TaxID=2946699 RepID=UPI001EF4FD2B|nr:autotransporter outer membrane beta-barrel domain-containing protein [Snodgrassella communis]
MNTIYKSKWNESTRTWVACSELTRGKTKSNCLKIVAFIALALATTNTFAANCQYNDPNAIDIIDEDGQCQLSVTDIQKLHASDNVTIQADAITIDSTNFNSSRDSVNTLELEENAQLNAKKLVIKNNKGMSNTTANSTAINLTGSSKIFAEEMNITNGENGDSITNLVNVEGSKSNIESQGSINIVNEATGVQNIILNKGNITAKQLEKHNLGKGEQGYDINNSGTINADSIELSNSNRSDGKNQSASILQNKGKNSITAGSIKITGNYTEAIKQEGGTISSSSTTIHTTLRDSDPESASATGISISNGTYTNGLSTTITANSENGSIREDFVGITLKEKSTFNNEGTIIVNPTADPLTPSLQIGQNTAVKTQLQPSKAATFDNGSSGKVITKEGVNTIVHGSEGDLTVNNKGELESQNSGNTITAGSVLKNSGKGGLIINNAETGAIKGNITNEEEGKITINNTDFGNIAGGYIINKKGGNIKITNESIFGSEIRNEQSGAVTLTNNNMSSGEIENLGTGSIEILNQGNRSGNITNRGDKIPDKNNITIKNNNILMGNIVNYGKGTINIINDGNIPNMSNFIENAGSGDIILQNNKNISGNLYNTGSGDFNFQNTGEYDGQIQNSSTKSFKIDNTGTINISGTISNSDAGIIKITNSGSVNDGQIINSAAGQVNLANNGTLSNILIINQDDSPTTSNNDERINITNRNKIVSSFITNEGLGAIIINNLGKIDADSAITNDGDNKDALINIINEQSLLAPISNNKTGRIEFTNKEAGTFENSSLTNKGSGQIQANNAGSFNDIRISNDGAGSNIDFTNTGIFSGSLTSINSGTITATNSGTFTGTTNINPDAYKSAGTINLKNLVGGTWINTGNSTLSELTNTGTIKFPSIPEAAATDKNKYHTITVDGDYTGGGNIVVNTIWNKNENAPNFTDQLIIKGNVIGDARTTVKAENGIYGDITIPEIPLIHSAPVIHVDGNTNKNSFQGSAATKNAGEAQLKRIDSKEGTDYAWTLLAEPKPDPVKPAPTEPAPTEPAPTEPAPTEPAPTEPVKPINPVPPKRVPIYAEPVSGYVQMPTADMELGFTTIGTLHERRSENQTNNINSANNTAFSDTQQQTWGRVVVEHLDKNGKKRLDTGGSQSVLQIGHDFILDNNTKTGARRHIGGYVSYGHNENDFRDQYRAENGYIVDDHYTGKGRTDAVSIGGYGTFYGNNGGYVDLVGQVTYLRNKYNARSNESVHQNGWGAALSAEAGKSFIVYGNNWFVEPQAQLVYQYLSLDDFNDRYRHIDQHNPSALRGRMGMRFGYNGDITDNLPPSSFYGIANIWHDFVNPKSVDIGRDTLKEEYAKTWGEIGAGIQWSITRQSDFYGDVRYEKNFGSDKRKGFKGTLGYKYTWL